MVCSYNIFGSFKLLWINLKTTKFSKYIDNIIYIPTLIIGGDDDSLVIFHMVIRGRVDNNVPCQKFPNGALLVQQNRLCQIDRKWGVLLHQNGLLRTFHDLGEGELLDNIPHGEGLSTPLCPTPLGFDIFRSDRTVVSGDSSPGSHVVKVSTYRRVHTMCIEHLKITGIPIHIRVVLSQPESFSGLIIHNQLFKPYCSKVHNIKKFNFLYPPKNIEFTARQLILTIQSGFVSTNACPC